MKRCKGITLKKNRCRKKTSDLSQLCPLHRTAKITKTDPSDKRVYLIHIMSTVGDEYWLRSSIKKLQDIWKNSWWMREKEWEILRATWNTKDVEVLASSDDFGEESPFPKLMRQKKKYPVYGDLPDEIWHEWGPFGGYDIFYDHKPKGKTRIEKIE